VWFRRYTRGQTDTQTHRDTHKTDVLITILRNRSGGRSNNDRTTSTLEHQNVRWCFYCAGQPGADGTRSRWGVAIDCVAYSSPNWVSDRLQQRWRHTRGDAVRDSSWDDVRCYHVIDRMLPTASCLYCDHRRLSQWQHLKSAFWDVVTPTFRLWSQAADLGTYLTSEIRCCMVLTCIWPSTLIFVNIHFRICRLQTLCQFIVNFVTKRKLIDECFYSVTGSYVEHRRWKTMITNLLKL